MVQLSSTTCFSAPIGDYLPCYPFDIPLIGRKDVMNFPSSNEQLTSSIPVQLDGQSLLLVSYVTSNLTSFVGIVSGCVLRCIGLSFRVSLSYSIKLQTL